MILMFAVNFIIFLLLTTLILIESNCSNEQCENELLPLKHLISQYFQDPEIVTPVNDIYLLTINLPIIDQVLDFCLTHELEKYDCFHLVNAINNKFMLKNNIDFRIRTLQEPEIEEKIVTFDLVGGLGNQLFQIFATLAYGIRTNTKVMFPYKQRGSPVINSPGKFRPFYFDNFLFALRQNTTFSDNNNTNDANDRLLILPQFIDNHKPIPAMNSSIRLVGNYLSYRYFEDSYDKICDIINLKSIQSDVKFKYSHYFPINHHIVGMHFRLGDYKYSNLYKLLSFDYYDLGIQIIIAKAITADSLIILYCSEKEDNALVDNVIESLKVKYPKIRFIKISDDIPDWVQLLLLSLCHDIIIANSTFSWWSAYFNSYSNKLIVYPDTYYTDKLANEKMTDYYPREWIKIQINHS